jgi:hypothetical protein
MKNGLKIGCGIVAGVLLVAAAFYGPTAWSLYSAGVFNSAMNKPEKEQYSAGREENLRALYVALMAYHDSEGAYPPAESWMDAIANRLQTNNLKKGEGEKKFTRPGLTDGQYGYAMNTVFSGKYKGEIGAETDVLLFESQQQKRNASGDPKEDKTGLTILVNGSIGSPK